MSTLRSDSPLVKQIVRSFLHFLSSVELTPEVDVEAVIVASQCLGDAFGVDIQTSGNTIEPDLVQLFKQSGEDGAARELPSIPHSEPVNHKPPNPTEGIAGPSQLPKNASSTCDAAAAGMEDRLFEQFKEGLESAGYFDGLSGDTSEFEEFLKRSKTAFSETLQKVWKPGISEQIILAEAFKAQGNTSMANSHFVEAIDLYTMAISLCGDNAVYYSNRAAAHTQVGKYEAAIADSNKAIQLDPNYSKAYSRLGLAYYTQGKYQEAIEKGFQKAHQLDPNSKSIQENLLVAQKKLEEEHVRSRQSNPEPSEQQPYVQSNNETEPMP
ncbi:hypothetical protein GOP47_0022691 [Adiantum capillus-veneris]|uniref:SGTA homodimerisation domain-containing protein n=1 Tax=Adiantum capillus-veneris TaxID=13818 RepID=A0A9D4Z692_ADICA|nr:hypothetical protein GOP47_0022691 [Adiantum capillus-veneris]